MHGAVPGEERGAEDVGVFIAPSVTIPCSVIHLLYSYRGRGGVAPIIDREGTAAGRYCIGDAL